MKPKLGFQCHLFHEEDNKQLSIISKYFDVHTYTSMYMGTDTKFDAHRCSVYNAIKFGILSDNTNVLNWAGLLRSELVSSDFYLQTLDYILEYNVSWPIFVRPIRGTKIFAGGVFSKQQLQNEYNFLLQRNVEKYLMCMVATPRNIEEEYRFVFIDGKLVGKSRYMDFSGFSVDSNVPNDATEYAKSVHSKYNLPDWIVLDVATVNGTYKVIELNQLETSSFYGCDLDEIYSAWSKTFVDSGAEN